MPKEIGAEIIVRAFEFFDAIDSPVSVEEFFQLEFTGDRVVDAFIFEAAQAMLEALRNGGAVNCDELSSPDARIYGLTLMGVEMLQQVREHIKCDIQ